MRRAAKVDGNHKQLLDLARQLGCFVLDTSSLGQGAPDAFVWRQRPCPDVWPPRTYGWFAVEIKGYRGKLTKAQKDVHARVQVEIWRTEDDVLMFCGVAPLGGRPEETDQ